MKKFFNLQRFAVEKISLTSGADEYENVKARQIIYALGGNDSVRTDIYNNVTIFGGKGADSLDGWRGQKIYLAGDAGNDIIEGTGIKNLTLSGGVGNDSIAAYGSQNVSIVGGAGKDSIYFDPGDVYYKSKNIFISAGIGNDYIQNYGRNDNATIIGGKGNDLISVGEYAKNNLFKYALGDGNDTIFGFDSNDTLQITSGSYSTTKSGTDFIVNVGKQKIILKDAVNDKYDKIHIKNSAGEVAVYNNWKTRKGTSAADNLYSYANKVKISLGGGDDVVGNYGDQVSISGGKGDDIISNYGNKTTIVGGSGADNISNHGDNVKISGGKGNDNIATYDGNKVSISGGAGNDFISAAYETISEKATTIYGGAGNDTISLPGSNFTKYTVQYNTGDGNDTIIGFDDSFTLMIDGKVKTDFYTEENRYNDFTLKVGKGSIFFKGGVGISASSLLAENNFSTADNLSAIVENNLSAVSEIKTQKFDSLTQENLITFS